MCYHETLSFLTCSHKLKTTTFCPSFLRFEHKTFGPTEKRKDLSMAYRVTFKPDTCKYRHADNFIVAALCPECNDEEKWRYGSASRDWLGYRLGRDAWYTGEGKDGMGDKLWGQGRRRVKLPKGEKNGELIKRRIEGVVWQYEDGYYGGA